MSTVELCYHTYDVFTSKRFGGNQLAVVTLPESFRMDHAYLQAIAKEFNYSETIFLKYEGEQGGTRAWRLKIYTIDQCIPFAGHPVIGAAAHIHHPSTLDGFSAGSAKTILHCDAGDVPFIAVDDDASPQRLVLAEPPSEGQSSLQVFEVEVPQTFHAHAARPSIDSVLALQGGLQAQMIKDVEVVSIVKGMTFLLVELTDAEALSKIRVTHKPVPRALDAGWDVGFMASAFYHAVSTNDASSDASQRICRYRTRMIEASMEDVATGSMSCALAGLLALQARRSEIISRADFVFDQGQDGGRQGQIGVTVDLVEGQEQIKTIKLRGAAVQMMKGHLTIPQDSE